MTYGLSVVVLENTFDIFRPISLTEQSSLTESSNDVSTVFVFSELKLQTICFKVAIWMEPVMWMDSKGLSFRSDYLACGNLLIACPPCSTTDDVLVCVVVCLLQSLGKGSIRQILGKGV